MWKSLAHIRNTEIKVNVRISKDVSLVPGAVSATPGFHPIIMLHFMKDYLLPHITKAPKQKVKCPSQF